LDEVGGKRRGAVEVRLMNPYMPAWNWYGTIETNSNESKAVDALNATVSFACPPPGTDTFASEPFVAKYWSIWLGVQLEFNRTPGWARRVKLWTIVPWLTRWKVTLFPEGAERNSGAKRGVSVMFTSSAVEFVGRAYPTVGASGRWPNAPAAAGSPTVARRRAAMNHGAARRSGRARGGEARSFTRLLTVERPGPA
jgi:hypothetical protein